MEDPLGRTDEQSVRLLIAMRLVTRAIATLTAHDATPDELITHSCQQMVNSDLECHHAWILLVDQNGFMRNFAYVGLPETQTMTALLTTDIHAIPCVTTILDCAGSVYLSACRPECPFCPARPSSPSLAVIGIALIHQERVLGILAASFPPAYAGDVIFQEVVQEVAQGIVAELLKLESVARMKAAQEALRESEQTYRSLFDNMMNGVAYCRLVFENDQPSDFQFIAVNKAFEAHTGLTDVVGRTATTVIAGLRESDQALLDLFVRVVTTGQPEQAELFVTALQMWFQLSVFCPKAEHFVVVFNVVTAHKQAETLFLRDKEVQATVARLGKEFLACREEALEEVALRVLDASLKLTRSRFGCVNELDPRTGWAINRAITKGIAPLCQEMDQHALTKVRRGMWGWVLDHRLPLRSNNPQGLACFLGTPAGHISIHRYLSVPVSSGGNLVAQIAVANGERDYDQGDTEALELIADLFAIVLERIKLERQLRHAGKMEAVGTLSAGIAHDFNNILGIIMGNAELAQLKVSKQDSLGDDLEEIVRAGNRAKALVQQLLTFSRSGDSPRQFLPLIPLVKEAARFLRSSIPSSIEISTRIGSLDMQVVGNEIQLYQLLINLCTNARQAILRDQGRITITLERTRVVGGRARIAQLSPGEYVLIQVQDSGAGITAEALDHIFEPFFTTKELGKGTGLGLAVAHGIVTSHGGVILVESTPGEGSTFRVYLPRVESEKPPQVMAVGTTAQPRRVGTLLVVDDEPQLLSIYNRLLATYGYDVVTAGGSLEALRLFADSPERFSALVTDQSMPSMTGHELAGKARAIRPDLPVILCTGLGGGGAFQAVGQDGAISIVLHKPVSGGELAEALNTLLHHPADKTEGCALIPDNR